MVIRSNPLFCIVFLCILLSAEIICVESISIEAWKGGSAPFQKIDSKSVKRKDAPVSRPGLIIQKKGIETKLTDVGTHATDSGVISDEKEATVTIQDLFVNQKVDAGLQTAGVKIARMQDDSEQVMHDEDNIVLVGAQLNAAASVHQVPQHHVHQQRENSPPAPITTPVPQPKYNPITRPVPVPAPSPPLKVDTKPAKKNRHGNGFNNDDLTLWEYLFENNTVWEGERSVYYPRSCRGQGPISEYEFWNCKRSDRDAYLVDALQLPPITDEASLIIALTNWCKDERDLKLNPSQTFFASYGSVLECVIMLNREIKRVRVADSFYVHDIVNKIQPLVPIPEVSKASNPRLARLVDMARQADSPCTVPFDHPDNWMNALADQAVSYHSQSTQDGILIGILRAIKPTNNYYVEIGYNDDQWVAGSNCYTLNRLLNWRGLLLDARFDNPEIGLHKHFVYPHNILELFEKYDVPPNPDYISVDIDSQDLWLARKILSSEKYRPRVMSIEYNAHLPIGSTATMPPGKAVWNRVDLFYGTSAGSIKLLAAEFNYDIVQFAGAMDIFIVQREVLNGLCPPNFASFANRVDMLHTCVQDPERKHKWIDYPTYMQLVEAQLELTNASANAGSDVDGDSDSDVSTHCRSEYDCNDPFILETAQNAALEQYLLMTKVSENYASTASCTGFI